MSARRWCVTVNNYDDDDLERIKSFCTSERCQYAVFGKEIGENGTRHIQGFLHMRKKVRMTTLKKNVCKTGHYETAKGSDDDNQKYCSKEGEVFHEVGTPAPKHGTNTSYVNAIDLSKRLADGESLIGLLKQEHYAVAYLRHAKCIEDIVDATKRDTGKARFESNYLNLNLVMYEWQVQLYNLLVNNEPSDRYIYWYVDYYGCAGKSTFVNYFLARHPSRCFFGGKISDLSYAYNYEKYVFFDLSRSGFCEYLMGFMEQLKNGRIFSSKYKSSDKFFSPPHVVVFSNKLPLDDSFSSDRLRIKNISDPLEKKY